MERIDAEILKPLWEKLKSFGEYRIVVSPDHYTPVSKRIHVGEPVPFAACGKGIPAENAVLSEKNAGESGWAFKPGFDLMPWFLKGGVSD
jgi:2,3-bisphosphoglycerate-independent phosphoglycerate mutase